MKNRYRYLAYRLVAAGAILLAEPLLKLSIAMTKRAERLPRFPTSRGTLVSEADVNEMAVKLTRGIDVCVGCRKGTMKPRIEGDVKVYVCDNCGKKEPVIGSHESR